MSLHPTNNPIKRSWLLEQAQPLLRRNLWWIMYLFAALGGLVAGWALFSPVTPA